MSNTLDFTPKEETLTLDEIKEKVLSRKIDSLELRYNIDLFKSIEDKISILKIDGVLNQLSDQSVINILNHISEDTSLFHKEVPGFSASIKNIGQ